MKNVFWVWKEMCELNAKEAEKRWFVLIGWPLMTRKQPEKYGNCFATPIRCKSKALPMLFKEWEGVRCYIVLLQKAVFVIAIVYSLVCFLLFVILGIVQAGYFSVCVCVCVTERGKLFLCGSCSLVCLDWCWVQYICKYWLGMRRSVEIKFFKFVTRYTHTYSPWGHKNWMVFWKHCIWEALSYVFLEKILADLI